MNFADKYALAGLQPGPDIIGLRKKSIERVPKDLKHPQVLNLCRYYFDLPNADVQWLTDILVEDDGSFSLITNAREMKTLVACVLSDRIEGGYNFTTLSVLVASAMGKRQPVEAAWLLEMAAQAEVNQQVATHRPPIAPDIKKLTASKLAEEIEALSENEGDYVGVIGKVRAESISNSTALITQCNAAVSALAKQNSLLQEQTNILWWLYGASSNYLDRPFADVPFPSNYLLCGLELAELCLNLGPVATPVMLERMAKLSKKGRGTAALSTAVEGIDQAAIEKIPLSRIGGFDDLFVVHSALEKYASGGPGIWQALVAKETGLDVTAAVEPRDLGIQAFREYRLAVGIS
ncbi:GTPase-associated system all-helical protein GASH [Brevundimonas fontaquae]|uniref:GTPase-associated system helical domain-containing protein n=1 Tax=Brevundimonas fontaquae TaxID=2813778 RepID=A0ABX7LNN5_9CAUL|nr:GTPase-associated system all-helical protein GASH [Brevundimonas fontaquae]QSF53560.1 hypothetical protein JX001_12315 [Brevundimonas fontaquae]